MAGGLLLLIMGIEMMRSSPPAEDEAVADTSSSVLSIGLVPLAIPILAGPGAISTVIIVASDHESASHRILVAGAVALTSVITYAALRLAVAGDRFFTPTAAVIFARVMGLIVAAIAVEFVLDGIAGHFPDLVTVD